MAQREKTSPPGSEMINAVSEMLRNLEEISTDPSIIGSCPELPGIVLDKVQATLRDRDGAEYAELNRDFNRLRAEYLQALVAHPIGRGLALLAVGSEGSNDGDRTSPVVDQRSAPRSRQTDARPQGIVQLPSYCA
ncbi:MAG TPA: hypothetical protein VGY91_06980 [Chthoniobacterales bacterium]|jgi:hypothetical protein|nr:hypothetical protein [Chthoniobacterales bacterium]